MNAGELIKKIAAEMGFQSCRIAGLEPMKAELEFYKDWLSNGYAASMEYLKRAPEKRHNPALLYPHAQSCLLLSVSYYNPRPPDPGAEYGYVARYAVGLDYHTVIADKIAKLKESVEEKLGRPLLARSYTDDVELFEPGLAARHGAGFIGKNSLVIAPRLLGSYHFLAELFTDLSLEAEMPYEGSCGKCVRCSVACPTDAIVSEKELNANLCISFLTIENKGGIPIELREKMGNWVFGCDICQEVCPYNQKPPETPWQEFKPEEGAGHYLNLFELLALKNKAEFSARFGKTALSRPKRRGLLRNALVVIGNRLPQGGERKISEFLEFEEDEMLFEHGLWALSKYEGGRNEMRKLAFKHKGKESIFSTYLFD